MGVTRGKQVKKKAAKKAGAKKKAAAKKKAGAKKKAAAKKKPAGKKAAKKKAGAKKKVAAKKKAGKKAAAKKKPAAKTKPAGKKAAKKKAGKKAPAKKATAKKRPVAALPAIAWRETANHGLPDGSRELLAELEASARHALDHLRTLGVEHAEVAVSQGERLEAGIRQGAVELIKEAKSRGLSVRIVHDERVATSSTNDLDRESVERFLVRVVEMAELSEQDPLAVPPDPDELTREFPDLDLWDGEVARLDADRALHLAQVAEQAAFAFSDKITSSEGAGFSRSESHSVLATSGGFIGHSAGTHASLVAQVIADDEGGKKRNGYHWTAARKLDELIEPEAVGREAALRAVRSLGSIKLETGIYPIVFEREAAGAIIGLIASCVVGDAVYREQSYLGDRLGTRVASDLVTIVDDPLLPRGPGSRRFDGEGRAVRRNTVIDAGRLECFLLDTYSARKLKLEPTGSAGGGGGVPHSTTSNFFLLPGAAKPDDLFAGIERGLFVTSMMGFGFDPVTGNFSRGASGFLIENGKPTVPVSEVTVSRNLDELLQGIDAIADDLEHRSSIASPSFRVDRMTVSGL
jgi:PmbA protein